MIRIDTLDNLFHDADKFHSGTVITAEWLNMVQEEIARAIEILSDKNVDGSTNTQLANAIVSNLNKKAELHHSHTPDNIVENNNKQFVSKLDIDRWNDTVSLRYMGEWDAKINSPTIPRASILNNGWYYRVSADAEPEIFDGVQLGPPTTIDGISDWKVGDWIISNGSRWDKINNSTKGLVKTINNNSPDENGNVQISLQEEITPLQRAENGEVRQVTGYAINGLPDSETQTKINILLNDGWPEWAIIWRYLGERSTLTIIPINLSSTSSINNLNISLNGGIITVSSGNMTSTIGGLSIALSGGTVNIDNLLSQSLMGNIDIQNATLQYFALANLVSNGSLDSISIYGPFSLSNIASISSIDNIVVTNSGGTVTVDGAISSTSLDDIVVNQNGGTVSINDEASSTLIDNITVTQNGGIVSVSGLNSLSSIDDIIILSPMTVNGMSSASTIDGVIISLNGGSVTINSLNSDENIDGIVLTQSGGTVSISNLVTSSTIDNITLNQYLLFTISNILSDSTINNIALIGNLVTSNITSNSSLDAVSMVQSVTSFDANSATITSSIENITIDSNVTVDVMTYFTTSNVTDTLTTYNSNEIYQFNNGSIIRQSLSPSSGTETRMIYIKKDDGADGQASWFWDITDNNVSNGVRLIQYMYEDYDYDLDQPIMINELHLQSIVNNAAANQILYSGSLTGWHKIEFTINYTTNIVTAKLYDNSDVLVSTKTINATIPLANKTLTETLYISGNGYVAGYKKV